MKLFSMLALVFALSLSIVAGDAEAAKRLGGGKSSGLQRQSTTLNQPAATPAQTPAAAPAMAAKQSAAPAAAAAQPAKRSWMGPLAGLAAGLGLAALASHFGFGDELASMLLIGLLVAAVMVAISFFLRRRGTSGAQPMQYAPAGMSPAPDAPVQEYGASTPVSGSAAPQPVTTQGSRFPADFDAEGFVRNAKINFLRLQAANDAGNLDDIREFTSPEMFAEIKLAMADRGAAQQEVDVVALEATVLDVAEEANRYVVSVRFTGQIREDKAPVAEPFDEIWHLTKPINGQGGWVVAGIQQAH